MSTPWTMTIWVICQNYRPFDYRFSRAAAFDRAKELREGAPSGKWSVEQRTAQISLLDRSAAPGVIHAEAQA